MNKLLYLTSVLFLSGPLLAMKYDSESITLNEQLEKAIRIGLVKESKRLLDLGADVNFKSKILNNTPLMIAAGQGHVECIRMLLEAEAEVNVCNNFNTALTEASKKGCIACINILLKAGANVNYYNIYCTALMEASENGHVECMRILIDSGANINKRTNLGTALTEAAGNGRVECMKLLLALNADVDTQDKHGNTALINAANCGSALCARLLLNKKAAINIRDSDGDTALIRTAIYDKIDCMKVLIAENADMTIINEQGNTALFEAAKRGRINCVKYLTKPWYIGEIRVKVEVLRRLLNSNLSSCGYLQSEVLLADEVLKQNVILVLLNEIWKANREVFSTHPLAPVFNRVKMSALSFLNLQLELYKAVLVDNSIDNTIKSSCDPERIETMKRRISEYAQLVKYDDSTEAAATTN